MLPDLKSVFSSPDEADAEAPRPVHLVEKGALGTADGLTADQLAWAKANAFDGSAGSAVLVPAAEAGAPPVALVGIGEAAGGGEPCGPGVLNLGRAPGVLPKGRYTLASGTADATLASIAWGLGGYRFSAFKAKPGEVARLVVPEAADADRVRAVVAACHLGRDMINTPANAMGPEEIAQSAKTVGEAFGAEVSIARGEDAGFAEAYPLIDAVGRASDRKPRLVDLKWGDANAPKITLVGKGIAFDTGGLDLKPPAGMLLMKKDMGGAAAALAAAAMIMALKLPVRLRLLIATAENSVSGNAFRPGDVIKSRGGHTVEIGNTDAEGRLVLADALAVGDEDAPDTMITFATLTGAARVALGADLPALFSTDDDLAARIMAAGLEIGDPSWRMPFWPGYDKLLAGQTADISNVSDGPFGGAITAALFLKRFVKSAKAYAHFDLYGWRQGQRALGPKGGEVHTARAVVSAIEGMVGRGATG
jgi:leucyl aminopeptidase